MSEYILPVLILLLIIYAFVKNTDIYGSFVEGGKKSLKLIFDIFSYLMAIFVIIELFRVSGLANLLSTILAPIFTFLGIPIELSELVLLRPFSGSGSMALLTEIYNNYGVDSYASRVASVIISSTDTVFYVATVFFSKTKVKKLSYALPLALITTFIAILLSCWICRII